MSFRDNLQHLRATRNMTQEQLAMLVGVSRQSVTKWEAEKAYPDMDKLLKLCDVFGCTLDELVQGDLTSRPAEPGLNVSAGPAQDVCGYDDNMRQYAKSMAMGMPLTILGVAGAAFLDGVHPSGLPISSNALSGLVFLAFMLAGLCLIIPAGIRRSAFVKAHPYVEDFYTAKQKDEANRLFSRGLVGGIAAIFAGIMISAALNDSVAWVGSAFLVCVALGVALILYASLMRSRVNVGGYNESALENLSDDEIRGLGMGDTDALIRRRRRNSRTGSLCGIIMIVATAIALLLFFLAPTARVIFWLPWPIGGLACGVVSLAYGARD